MTIEEQLKEINENELDITAFIRNISTETNPLEEYERYCKSYQTIKIPKRLKVSDKEVEKINKWLMEEVFTAEIQRQKEDDILNKERYRTYAEVAWRNGVPYDGYFGTYAVWYMTPYIDLGKPHFNLYQDQLEIKIGDLSLYLHDYEYDSKREDTKMVE